MLTRTMRNLPDSPVKLEPVCPDRAKVTADMKAEVAPGKGKGPGFLFTPEKEVIFFVNELECGY